jgi:SEC-C motif-containing protein
VLNNGAYLHRTWHSQTRPNKKSLMQLEATEWQGLQILRTEQGLETDNQGIVEFIASFQVQDQIQQMQETSRFLRENGRWVYVDALS